MSQSWPNRVDYAAYVLLDILVPCTRYLETNNALRSWLFFRYTGSTAAFSDSQQQCWQDKVSSLPKHLTWLADPADASDILVLISHFSLSTSYDCPSTREATMKNMGKFITWLTRGHWCNDNKNWVHIDGLVQKEGDSIANTLELRLSCTNPSIYDTLRDMIKSSKMSLYLKHDGYQEPYALTQQICHRGEYPNPWFNSIASPCILDDFHNHLHIP